jgi:hypothetical protein
MFFSLCCIRAKKRQLINDVKSPIQCFDSLFMSINGDKYPTISSLDENKKVFSFNNKLWIKEIDASNLSVYCLNYDKYNYLIICCNPVAPTGVGVNFFVWTIIDMDNGREHSTMSLSKNKKSFYLKDGKIYFICLDYGEDFFYKDRIDYFDNSTFSVGVETYILLESKFELEKIDYYEIKSDCLLEK